MRKIDICLDNNTINLSYLYIDPTIINVEINKSVYKYIFSEDYISENFDFFCNLIKNLVNKKNVKIINVEDDLYYLGIKVIKSIKKMMCLNIQIDKMLNNTVIDLIIKSKFIKKIICYDLPFNRIKDLDKAKIKFITRNNNIKKSNFTKDNNIKSYSDLHNLEDVKIISSINEEYLQDFDNFLKENKNLKSIYLYGFQNQNAEKLINNINFGKKNKFKINLFVDSSNVEIFKSSIENIKSLKKKYSKLKNISFEIIYSEEYYKKNYFKQLSLLTLKACFIIAIVFGVSSIGIMTYNNNKSENDMKKVTKILKAEPEHQVDKVATIENNEINEDKEDGLVEDFNKLLSINDQTVGWLKVNGTNINLPVVQNNDNEFYLNNNFYKKRNINGWAFMDYRNDPKNFGKNTIIYGHNGTIFGTLKNVLLPYWYRNENNHIITFNTQSKQMKFKVFSVYETTTDFYYIDTVFNTEDEFLDLVNEMKEKSYYNFNTEVNGKDKILTLSTCTKGGKKRIVLNAKLIQ